MKILMVAAAMLALIATPAQAQVNGKRHQGDEKKTEQPEKRIDDTIIETSSHPWLSRPMLLRLALLPAYRSSPRVAPRPATSAQDGIVDGLLATSRIVLRTMARGGRQHASLYDTIGQ